MELFKASRQWAVRPDDERFTSVEDLHRACVEYRAKARTAQPYWRDLRPVAMDEGEVGLLGVSGTPARLSNWAFSQLCARSKSPAAFLRELPASLAVDVLANRMAQHGNGDRAALMFHENGGLLLRAVTSMQYQRIWNSDVTSRLRDLVVDGWRVPPARPARAGQAGTRPATEADVLEGDAWGLSVKVGDMIAPAGIYGSDHDVFVFMIDQRNPLVGPDGSPLYKGFFVWNSEVGAASFGLMTFRFRRVCGNHIVWDAQDAIEVRLRHTGEVNDRAFRSLRVELRRYCDSSVSDEEARIAKAATYELGASKEKVLDAIWKRRLVGVTQSNLGQAYDLTERNYPADGSPRTAWGMAQGMTRLSQLAPYAEDRVALDRAAGKVLAIAF